MALSAVRSERRVDSRTRITGLSDLSRAFCAPAKLNSIGSTYPGGYKSFIRFKPRPDEGKEERCGAFCGLTTTNA
jgi:hypothetical protein